ncbi:MAG: hypothetical protein RIQ52_208 [Pseudomonadota bacterium]
MKRRERGIALVVVVWTLALLTIMAGSFSQTVKRGNDLVASIRASAQAYHLAEGGVHYAMMMLSLRDPRQRWKADGRRYEVSLPTGRLYIVLRDEGGKLDVNVSSEQALRTLLLYVTRQAELAEQIAHGIVDWRDEDDIRLPRGAEKRDYLALGLPYFPLNRNFILPEELLQVRGVTPEIYRRLLPLITVYSQTEGVNPAKADAAMLGILFRGDQRKLERYLEARLLRPNAPPPAASTGDKLAIPFNAAADQVFSVEVSAVLQSGESEGIYAVIRQGGSGLPFTILRQKSLNDG